MTLTEWALIPSAPSVAAGKVAITAHNRGNRPHEVVMARLVDATTISREPDAGVDRAKLPPKKMAGEIELFPAGESCTAVFDLGPGTYVLYCDIKPDQDRDHIDHLRKGMADTITVT